MKDLRQKWYIHPFEHLLLRENATYVQGVIRGHPFSTYATFSEKLTFLTPLIRTYVCVSGGKKC